MHSSQYPYLELHDAMVECRGRFSAGALVEWHSSYPAEATWLDTFRRNFGPQSSASSEDSWRLYALSRVLEVMNLSFQSGDADDWSGPGLSQSDAATFAADLGLTVLTPDRYTAFDCEIAEVVSAPDDTEVVGLLDIQWPAIMLGDMLLCRAGVRVRAAPRIMNPAIAANSTLYWAYRRRNRPNQDLSHGWGHNSQWRTSFRRDYRVGVRTFYNVDGRHDLAAKDLVSDDVFPLTRSERTELLINRCFVVTPKAHDDLWPYDDRLTTNT